MKRDQTRLLTRRRLLIEMGAMLGVAAMWRPRTAAAQAPPQLVVYKDPNCGCCTIWVEHMRANGFSASVTNGDMEPIHTKHKIPRDVQSCHTALVGGYIVEGHVPASDVKTLLAKKPKGILGLAIPGMPASAPGMDMTPFQPYTVLTFDAAGKTTIYAKHDKAGAASWTG